MIRWTRVSVGASTATVRRQRRETDDPQERFRLERRLLELRPMLTQMNQLAELTAHYYERGYDRDGYYTL